MIASAWLHDVVEDTPATLDDVEQSFGKPVADLVESLTNVSRMNDGNRAARKEIDRQHIAGASTRAKTVKLADLIDNCRDICKHDMCFANVYFNEMADLMAVLQDGNKELYRQAQKTYDQCSQQLLKANALQKKDQRPVASRAEPWYRGRIPPHLLHLFTNAFAALDIAEPVRSFKVQVSSESVRSVMEENSLQVACLRDKGLVQGYVQLRDLAKGPAGSVLRHFRNSQVIEGGSPFVEIIRVLTLYEYVFVSVLGEVVGYADRGCFNKAVARMWLFGIVTMGEMIITSLIGEHFTNESWRSLVPPARLAKAIALQQERERRGQACSLLDCLQLGDKGRILLNIPDMVSLLAFDSKRTAKRVINELESFRNNLAHSQDIATYDWAAIARLASRIEHASLVTRKG